MRSNDHVLFKESKQAVELEKRLSGLSTHFFSFKNFSALNFSKIYGLHEQYLNKLLLKYEQKLVTDFYK